jgi:hypothetical protein
MMPCAERRTYPVLNAQHLYQVAQYLVYHLQTVADMGETL